MARKKEDRSPQWDSQETADFLAIFARIEQGVTQPNKAVWKAIASHMRQKGYRHSAAQCQCMWKHLVNCYKGINSLNLDSSQQCPYFKELHAIFTSQSEKAGKLPLELGSEPKKKKVQILDKSSEEFSDEEDEDDDEGESERTEKSKKRKLDRERKRATAEKFRASNVRMVLEHFFQQQQRLELQWKEMLEKREEECRKREQEFQNVMACMESESFVKERQWQNQNDQRRAREDALADSRDVLFSAILDKLVKGGNNDGIP